MKLPKNIIGKLSCSFFPLAMIASGFYYGIGGIIVCGGFGGILLLIIWGTPENFPPNFKNRKKR
jgi:hypothetical protein